MRVHKNRLFNVVISIIMVVAMVATLCTTFEAESETVSAATAFEKSISEFPDSYKPYPVSYTHLRAHETRHDLVCRLLLEKKKYTSPSPRDGLLSRMPSSA